ncbi:hypothetical protein [Lysinibacillus sphaericus]|uniref:hypothetical protein n=1 Tax=Lysinibacillus TaxID=400634 RepID=UPI0007772BB5|nr:hypothetical protein [Lysinibacillus sphaericus]MBE5086172.1 hypothetical protein [Bacillus thuringiensis]AMO35324.1 hypothetical protein AR327_22805 [Lysinibacillus sphaericus]AMR93073.1 hypothetical protein A1T07_22980 [Lysinibacillus sphaericus]MBG9710743.1 hypothetical protein [Lysinibacillus sphaericus]MBG9730350.1 hypothetical protein [Lysinibacillus sphaericus]
MNKTWEPLLCGNERLVHDAMFSMKKRGGTITAITSFHRKFNKNSVIVAVQGLEAKGLVKYDNLSQEYTLV